MTTETGQRAGITISDADAKDFLTLDLRDILALIPEDGARWLWGVSGAEAVGPSAEALHSASDAGDTLSLVRLREIAAKITQTINGEFRSFRDGESEPWVVVRAVDSSTFDVISDDAVFLEKVRGRFKRVREYPPSEL